jgi:nucleoside-diphosphate-sugar epimerase
MRVLVTGAQGCIGAWVVKTLVERGLDVVALDLDPHPTRLSLIAPAQLVRKVQIETGAIEDRVRVKAVVRECEITHIVHLAAVLLPYCQANPAEGAMVNVIGTLNVFEAARDAGRPVRVAYASSAAVWGPQEEYGGKTLTEDDPTHPVTHYGVFKQANEQCARVFYYTNGISSIGLRPWAAYGVGRDRGLTADPTLALKAVALGERFTIRVSGYMDLQYVEDIADSFLGCLFSPLEGARVFNLVGDVVEMRELVDTLDRLRPGASRLISISGPQVPVAFRMDGSQLQANVSGLKRTSLAEGVEKTLGIFEQLRMEGRLTGS